MASSSIPTNPQASNVSQLLPKLHDSDADLRYMALNDLLQMFTIAHQNFLTNDYNVCAKTIDGLLNTLNDKNGEVQNMSIKCLGPFVNKCPETILCPLFERVASLSTDNTIDTSIPALALREIVVSLPRPLPGIKDKPAQAAYEAIRKALIPRLVGYHIFPPAQKNLPPVPQGMIEIDLQAGTDTNSLDVLSEIARCFGSMLHEKEVEALLNTTFAVIDAERAGSVLKKKAVIAVSTLAPHFSDVLLSSFISKLIENLGDMHLTQAKRKLYITILGSLARSIPKRFGPYLKTLAQFVLHALTEESLDDSMDVDDEDTRDPELDEVREAALIAVDYFLSSCPQDMHMYSAEVISAGTKFVKYDPNLADDDDDDAEMEADEGENDFEDEDFEEDGGYDDEDDTSWKIRRCAAKVLHTMINKDLLPSDQLYNTVAPSLTLRLKEREESVRLEIVAVLTTVIRKSPESRLGDISDTARNGRNGGMDPPPSKKRSRSDASMMDSQTKNSLSSGYASTSDVQEKIRSISSDIAKGSLPLLKNSSLATKQACIVLLRHISASQEGGLEDYLPQLTDPLLDAINASSTHGASATGSAVTANGLRMEALRLLGTILDQHKSGDLGILVREAVPIILTCSQDRYSKVAVEALKTVQQVIDAIASTQSVKASNNQQYLEHILDTLTVRISAKDVDTEVRREAIKALGRLLAATYLHPQSLPSSKREASLDLLLARMRNELTRVTSVRAVDAVLSAPYQRFQSQEEVTGTANPLSQIWVREIVRELCAQLRKSSRVLRTASLSAMEAVAESFHCRERLDRDTVQEIFTVFMPFLNARDLQMLTPTLHVFAPIIKNGVGQDSVNAQFIEAVGSVATADLGGATLGAYLDLIDAIGAANQADAMINDLVVNGRHPELAGKAIGTLLAVSKTPKSPTTYQNDLQNNNDVLGQRRAVSVLGEYGYRLQEKSNLQPAIFMDCFRSGNDQLSLAAAIAMGRAGSRNITKFLEAILTGLRVNDDTKMYALLHAVKGILQYKSRDTKFTTAQADQLWGLLLQFASDEDKKTIVAECIGRLVIDQPGIYLVKLKNELGKSRDEHQRRLAISALRFTFADIDKDFNESQEAIIVDMLKDILQDSETENRRLALTTVNSAATHKWELILPRLQELMPFIILETVIKPELIKEIAMGPFKIKVDEGLDVRKAAYETVYSLLDKAFNQLDIAQVFERVIAGVADDHDVRNNCNLIIEKLSDLAPDETASNLQAFAEQFRTVLSVKPKDNAVKQELEKIHDSNKGILKSSMKLNKRFILEGTATDVNQQRIWSDYYDWIQKEHGPLYKQAENEIKEEGGR